MDVTIIVGREFHLAAGFPRRAKNRLQMRRQMISTLMAIECDTSFVDYVDGIGPLRGLGRIKHGRFPSVKVICLAACRSPYLIAAPAP
jgi:hypothetical protein